MDDLKKYDTVFKQNKPSINAILRLLERSQENFSITIIQCNYKHLREEFISWINELSSVEMQTLPLDSSTKSLYKDINKRLEESIPKALLVYEFEDLKNVEDVLLATNNVREEFRKKFQFPIMLWANDLIVDLLINLAPDFESWTTKVKIELPNEKLVELLYHSTQHVFSRIFNSFSGGFLSTSILNEPYESSEIEAAWIDLKKRDTRIDSDLKARIYFVLGISSHVKNELDKARLYYEESLGLWQQASKPLQQSCVSFYLGLWWNNHASTKPFRDQKNNPSLIKAANYFQRCIDILEGNNRPDLAIKFINCLGEVWLKRQEWEKLEEVTKRASFLYHAYPNVGNLVGLARVYGFQAEIDQARSDYLSSKAQIEKAIDILNDLDPRLSGNESENERLNYLCRFWLLLSRAQKSIGQTSEAIKILKKAEKVGHQIDPNIYIEILLELQSIYKAKKKYREAFNFKRKRYSIQQQYGFRAFVGAGYLQPENTPRNSQWVNTIASEIEASHRSKDVEKLIQRLSTHRHSLTILYGNSGVGKSSLIHAGLVPALEQKEVIGGRDIFPPIVIQKYNDHRWAKDIRKLLQKIFQKKKIASLSSGIADSLDVNTIITEVSRILKDLAESNALVILIFDQLEDFFLAYKPEIEKEIFYNFLRNCLEIPAVKVILSLREDCLHYLLECDRTANLTAIGNDVLGKDFLYYLGNFSGEHAKSVIEALTKRNRFPMKKILVDRVVSDLLDEKGEVHPIELQLVGTQLEEDEIIDINHYLELGERPKDRVRTLIESWLRKVIEDCGFENEDTAWKVLYSLTHKENVRTIKLKSELTSVSSETLSRPRSEQIRLILTVLEDSGLVLSIREGSKHYYQLVHDYLIPYIREEYFRRFDVLGNKINSLRDQFLRHDSNDLFERLSAIIELGRLGSLKAIRPLISFIDRKDLVEVGLRWHIYTALSNIETNEEVETELLQDLVDCLVEKGLSDPEPAIQANVANLLGQLRHKRSKDFLLSGKAKYKDILISKCNDRYACVRSQARLTVMNLWNDLSLAPVPKMPESSKAYPLLAYVLIKWSADSSLNVYSDRIEMLRKYKFSESLGVVQGGAIYGNHDIIVKVVSDNIVSLNELVMRKIQGLDWVVSTRTLIVVNEPRSYYWSRRLEKNAPRFVSYVLIQAVALKSAGLVTCLMDVPEVSEAATVYGQPDVLAKIEVDKQELRDAVLTEKILRLPSIESTFSYSVISHPRNYYWDDSNYFVFPDEWTI